MLVSMYSLPCIHGGICSRTLEIPNASDAQVPLWYKMAQRLALLFAVPHERFNQLQKDLVSWLAG